MNDQGEDRQLLDSALGAARDTRRLEIGRGTCRAVPDVFSEQFGYSPCLLIADENTFAAAGRSVFNALRAAEHVVMEPLVLPGDIYAEYPVVARLCTAMGGTAAIPLVVGSGTLNDLTKRAAFECERPYMVVATAASMDGYTAFGASLTHHGSKQTFDCPAPRAVVADLDVIANAPAGMNAAGYADLIAKCPAGADWIVAEALGEEPIDPPIWDTVQSRLKSWLADPQGVREGNFAALGNLTIGLMMTGFAMQAACTSRPASGAEHQFSHLWDMEHHTHHSRAPSHGFKVGIGSLASAALYESLLERDSLKIDIDTLVAACPDRAANDREIDSLFDIPELAEKARLESNAKLITGDQLRQQLSRLQRVWPELRRRLTEQLIPRIELREMLTAAGAPVDPLQIGISRERLRNSYPKAYHIRRRITVLDLARRAGLLPESLDRIFAEAEEGNIL